MTKNIRPIRLEGNIAYLPLSQGYEALIDKCDVDLIFDARWHSKVKRHTVYARTNLLIDGSYKTTYLHRVLMGDIGNMQVDHIDGNGLNNRRENLRMVTHAENLQNQPASHRNTSGFKGVSWNKFAKKWVANIGVDGKSYYLGSYDSPHVAHAAYCDASSILHGQFGRVK